MRITLGNDSISVFDKHYSLRCHHCGSYSNISAVSIPRYEYLLRFKPHKIGICYRCDSCNLPIFLRFEVRDYSHINHAQGGYIDILEDYEEIEKPLEPFEYEHLPPSVAEDFKEALICYSNTCYNAFAAMCRRCIQSVFIELGALGKDKVIAQLKEIKETASLDDETYEMLEQITISGHDGAHPHLPKLSPARAKVLLELMKDVLYQLFVRKAKIQESVILRKQDIESSKSTPTN